MAAARAAGCADGLVTELTEDGTVLGDRPQAYTHLAPIGAATDLDAAGPRTAGRGADPACRTPVAGATNDCYRGVGRRPPLVIHCV
ncbi:hypothetical protein GCM10010145_21210 [Streptomyces ruber]|uniref:Uncharacterized protein n=2 Tax=Streptomyces TaxID=1883 RepID=A0A918ES58_9ACTN|nr:hypothetical protein GCM10010145_21210 [Streptomyces ruber]